MDPISQASAALVEATRDRLALIAKRDELKTDLYRLGEQITAANVRCCQADDNLRAALDDRISR